VFFRASAGVAVNVAVNTWVTVDDCPQERSHQNSGRCLNRGYQHVPRSLNASERPFVVVAYRDVVNDGTPEIIRRSHTRGVDDFESSPQISASYLFNLSDVTRRCGSWHDAGPGP
jgi:hypothetical protein